MNEQITKAKIKYLETRLNIPSDIIIEKLIKLKFISPKTHIVTKTAINEALKSITIDTIKKIDKKNEKKYSQVFIYFLDKLSNYGDFNILKIILKLQKIETRELFLQENKHLIENNRKATMQEKIKILNTRMALKMNIDMLERECKEFTKDNPQFLIKLFTVLEKENLLKNLIKLDYPFLKNHFIVYNKYQLEQFLTIKSHHSKPSKI